MHTEEHPTETDSLAADTWIEEKMTTLSREVLLAQLLHPRLTGNDEATQRRYLQEIALLQPGGLFQGRKPWHELRDLFETAATSCAIPPIVSGDYECRVDIGEGTSCGSAMNVGAVADLETAMGIAYAVGKNCAIQGRAVGTRWTLAPVGDVNINPENPITNVRAFSDDPARCAALAAAFVRGCQENGMAATLKHFPGDGLDSNDQHVTPAINHLPLEEWHRISGRPFREGIAAGVWTIMMGHLLFPALNDRDPKTGDLLPATISPAAHRMLREEFGFDGVIVSDAIGMGGLVWHTSCELDAVIRNLAAGSDMVLLPVEPEACFEAILKAIDTGVLDEEKLLQSVRRILRLKTKLGLHEPGWRLLDRETSALLFDQPDTSSAEKLAEASITLVRNADHSYPADFTPGDEVILFDLPQETPSGVRLIVAGQADDEQEEPPMAESLRQRGLRPVVVSSPAEFHAAARTARAAIYRIQARPQAGRNGIRFAYQALQFIEQTREPRSLQRYFVSLGSPYGIRELPSLKNFAVTYASVPACEDAYVRALLGEIPFLGRCPVQLPD